MFHLEVRFRHAEQLLGSEAETSGKKKEIYTSRRSPAILFALAESRGPPGGAGANFAPFLRCDTLAMQFNRE